MKSDQQDKNVRAAAEGESNRAQPLPEPLLCYIAYYAKLRTRASRT
jgi:hypothetical protein